MKLKLKDVILLARALEREASQMNGTNKEAFYEKEMLVLFKEENVPEGRLVGTLYAELGYAISNQRSSKSKTQENILLRVELYDVSENVRPVVNRIEQETALKEESVDDKIEF